MLSAQTPAAAGDEPEDTEESGAEAATEPEVEGTEESEDAKPTEANTVAEITAWLEAHGIDHDGKTLKADLLALIPAD